MGGTADSRAAAAARKAPTAGRGAKYISNRVHEMGQYQGGFVSVAQHVTIFGIPADQNRVTFLEVELLIDPTLNAAPDGIIFGQRHLQLRHVPQI
jgi:hypothetical protein